MTMLKSEEPVNVQEHENSPFASTKSPLVNQPGQVAHTRAHQNGRTLTRRSPPLLARRVVSRPAPDTTMGTYATRACESSGAPPTTISARRPSRPTTNSLNRARSRDEPRRRSLSRARSSPETVTAEAPPEVTVRPPPVTGRPSSHTSRYDHDKYRRLVRERGVTPRIARHGVGHGSGLGKRRWVVERTFAWLHAFKRLRMRYEVRADLHLGLLTLAAALICLRRLLASL